VDITITDDWGLLVCAVVLTVPTMWVRWETLNGVNSGAALTHFEVQTKRVHAKTKDAFVVYPMTWYLVLVC
jgi:hypothetical protein